MAYKSKIRQAARMADLTFELLANCQEKQERIAQKLNLTTSEFRCLKAFDADSQMPIKDIAGKMGLTSSRLTRIIDSMENKGLVRRIPDKTDRRVILVSLTAKGRDISAKLNDQNVKLHDEILANIPAESRDAVVAAMEKLRTALAEWLIT